MEVFAAYVGELNDVKTKLKQSNKDIVFIKNLYNNPEICLPNIKLLRIN
tara:strand:+ start:411 stop:557 length:147 start_codon:yes stop_codon:yes gene_type:complete